MKAVTKREVELRAEGVFFFFLAGVIQLPVKRDGEKERGQVGKGRLRGFFFVK